MKTPILSGFTNADYENQGKRDSGWKYRNDRIEDMEGFPGYVIPMVSERVSSPGETPPYTLDLDCSNIDTLFRDSLHIRVLADNEDVLDFTPIDMTLNAYINANGEQSSISIYGLPSTANQTAHVTVEIYKPSDGTSEEVVVASDTVKVTTSVFIMGDHTNYGQLYTADQDPRFMWDCDLANNTYKTPKSEGYCYKDGVQTGSEGFSYLESALSYNNGFAMDYSYTFDRSYGDAYGYVQAQDGRNKDKLSFVGNGGIKYGGESGSFEAAILDVRAMVAMICSADKQNPELGTMLLSSQTFPEEYRETLISCLRVPTKDGEILVENNLAFVKAIDLGNRKFDREVLTKLLDCIGYGSQLDDAYPAGSLTNSFYDGEQLKDQVAIRNIFADYLICAFNNTPVGNSICLDVAQPSTSLLEANSVTITSGETQFYQNSAPIECTTLNNKIYLQAHWGSGVTYVLTSIQSK